MTKTCKECKFFGDGINGEYRCKFHLWNIGKNNASCSSWVDKDKEYCGLCKHNSRFHDGHTCEIPWDANEYGICRAFSLYQKPEVELKGECKDCRFSSGVNDYLGCPYSIMKDKSCRLDENNKFEPKACGNCEHLTDKVGSIVGSKTYYKCSKVGVQNSSKEYVSKTCSHFKNKTEEPKPEKPKKSVPAKCLTCAGYTIDEQCVWKHDMATCTYGAGNRFTRASCRFCHYQGEQTYDSNRRKIVECSLDGLDRGYYDMLSCKHFIHKAIGKPKPEPEKPTVKIPNGYLSAVMAKAFDVCCVREHSCKESFRLKDYGFYELSNIKTEQGSLIFTASHPSGWWKVEWPDGKSLWRANSGKPRDSTYCKDCKHYGGSLEYWICNCGEPKAWGDKYCSAKAVKGGKEMIKLCETCRFGFRNTLSGKSECPLTCCCRSDWKDAMGSCSWTNEPRIKDVKTPEPEPYKGKYVELPWTNEPRIKDVKTPEPEPYKGKYVELPEPEKPQTLEDVYNERKELVDKYCATDISKLFDKVLFELYPLKKKRLCKRLTLNGFYTPLLRARKESWKFSFKKWKAVEEYMRYVITYYDEVIDIIERRKETELQRKAEKLQRKETKELIKVIGKRCKCGAKRRGKFCAKCGNTL